MQRLVLAILVAGLTAMPLAAADDAAKIRGAALDYAESWYEGDPARMERALHPDLAKRIVREKDGVVTLEHMGASRLIEAVGKGYGTRTPPEKRLRDVTILDVTGNAATVKLVMSGWVDYLHIAKLGDEWKIVNVLWETTP